ncbi:copper amine oxidase N-terminal domain-containing protein [Tepidibacter hydrothermalis]|uniref:Copper amine oxidase N-terminal domain-containing protein n=1 Tax=Tepidibacter hydrothermalis TaxID=3036126 RepID=A0ABY8EDD6_9FIRM|nr:copper amine oxidase N-terminal domain-containing protein [Tepidibacter hydrothermalis]WFD10786.1 copper amine oxidase N-terminal domain-containing protein [Tepidibacter hydrothermalis]
MNVIISGVVIVIVAVLIFKFKQYLILLSIIQIGLSGLICLYPCDNNIKIIILIIFNIVISWISFKFFRNKKYEYIFVSVLNYSAVTIFGYTVLTETNVLENPILTYIFSIVCILLAVYQKRFLNIFRFINMKSSNDAEAKDITIISMILIALIVFIYLTISKYIHMEPSTVNGATDCFELIGNDIFNTYILFFTLISECEKFIQKKETEINNKEVKIKINNNIVVFENAKAYYDENDKTVLVPIQLFTDALGATVREISDQIIEIKKESKSIFLKVECNSAYIERKDIKMNTNIKIINNVVYVPIEFICKHLGVNVTWQKYKRTIHIDNKDPIIVSV